MKTNFKITAAACLMFFGMANAFAQGGADRNPGTFSKIKANGSVNVELVQGTTSGVHIDGPTDMIEKVKTELNGDVLEISGGDDKTKVIVTAPAFTGISTNGAVNVKSQGKLTGERLKIETTGAVDVDLDVDITEIDVVATGASDVKLTGKTQSLSAEISGASDLKAYGLEAEHARLMVSGSSDANVNVKTSIDANASGSSDVRYIGNPVNKTINKSGTADVSHKDDAASGDTTRVGLGKKKYTIITDGEDDDDDHNFNVGSKGNFHFWQGLDIHMNAIVDSKNNADPLPGYDFMELNYPRSIGVSWNMVQKNINIYKNYVYLATGFGIDWSVYGFRNNTTLRHDTSFLAATFDTVDYKRNRLRAFYVQVPLMLEFTTSKNEDRAFHIGAGVLLGYNVFDNKLKQKYELDGKDYKNIVRDDFNINPVRYGLTARVGYGDYSIFANYNVSTLFEKDAGPKLYPVQVGFHITL